MKCIGFNRRLIARKINCWVMIKACFRLWNIFWQINNNWTCTPCCCDMNGFCYNTRHISNITNLIVVFCNWHCDTDNISFLKSIFPNTWHSNLSSKDKHWNTVTHPVSNTSNGVSCTWTTGHNGNPKFSCWFSISFCFVEGSLLMTCQNMANTIKIIYSVIKR